ncbi:hypothetical protein AB0D46_15905 [Streptomyces sp. NPDC048383]|uniref:hypothetical protein n=1 Tax=Streptomyces sp. NPDC048383 TaxID=3155386 RepID=UPI0034279238
MDGIGTIRELVRTEHCERAPHVLGAYIHRWLITPGETTPLLDLIDGAAARTVLPDDADTARRELRLAAMRAAPPVEWGGRDLRDEPVAVRSGCRRAAVALGVLIQVK